MADVAVENVPKASHPRDIISNDRNESALTLDLTLTLTLAEASVTTLQGVMGDNGSSWILTNAPHLRSLSYPPQGWTREYFDTVRLLIDGPDGRRPHSLSHPRPQESNVTLT
jgi:hypothetical protein